MHINLSLARQQQNKSIFVRDMLNVFVFSRAANKIQQKKERDPVRMDARRRLAGREGAAQTHSHRCARQRRHQTARDATPTPSRALVAVLCLIVQDARFINVKNINELRSTIEMYPMDLINQSNVVVGYLNACN